MHMIKRIPVLLTLLLATVTTTPHFAAAQEVDAGFSVSAVIPDNQIDQEAAYFDLLVTPGQVQDLHLEIVNPGEEEITVTMEAVTASTNRNGIINYSTAGTYDDSMRYSLAELTEIEEPEIKILPGQTKRATIALRIPNEPFEGMLLGSIRVVKQPSEDEQAMEGVVNIYSYAVGVRLWEDSIYDALPVFELGEVFTEQVNHKAAVVVPIRNLQPMVYQEVDVEAVVYTKDGQSVISNKLYGIEMAPNTVFPMSLVDLEGYGFAPGDYKAEATVECGGRTWEFSQDFTIREAQAAAINDNAVNQFQNTVENGEDDFFFTVLLALGLCIAGALVLLLVASLRWKCTVHK